MSVTSHPGLVLKLIQIRILFAHPQKIHNLNFSLIYITGKANHRNPKRELNSAEALEIVEDAFVISFSLSSSLLLSLLIFFVWGVDLFWQVHCSYSGMLSLNWFGDSLSICFLL